MYCTRTSGVIAVEVETRIILPPRPPLTGSDDNRRRRKEEDTNILCYSILYTTCTLYGSKEGKQQIYSTGSFYRATSIDLLHTFVASHE